jgi:hypothetical protein
VNLKDLNKPPKGNLTADCFCLITQRKWII